MKKSDSSENLNFIEEIIETDLKSNKHEGVILTRFPPEPNGFLHIGHVKAISINFEIAKKYGGNTNLRFDDTNPSTEDTAYVDAIKKDINWLGYDWQGEALFASDYFDQLYSFAVKLISKGLAYVDDSTSEEIAELKKKPGVDGIRSKYANRSIEENLDLFEKMKNGEFEDGSKVLRARVDMTSPNMHLRDPLLYRIKRETHHRTGDKWCIYPMYDFAHGQSDSIENITHSLCSLEFIHHRPLYNWLIENLEIYPSRQIEFARMNVSYMITSKRKLLKLVEDGIVSGWDDPRMPTVSGMRRKGYPAAALRNFAIKVGVAKRNNLIDVKLLESCIREELNEATNRVMVVLDPLKLTITNYPESKVEELPAVNNPQIDNGGTRLLPFSKSLWIERKDYLEDAPKKYYRLSKGRNVRLKHAYIIHVEDVVKNAEGDVIEVLCTYFDNTKSGHDNSGIKSKGVVHWVSVDHGIPCTVNNYDRLFTDPTPTNHEDQGKTVFDFINPSSLAINENAIMEPSLKNNEVGEVFQFMRTGYYAIDQSTNAERTVFNSTISLKEGW